jgi:hypothetical protein
MAHPKVGRPKTGVTPMLSNDRAKEIEELIKQLKQKCLSYKLKHTIGCRLCYNRGYEGVSVDGALVLCKCTRETLKEIDHMEKMRMIH